MDDRPITSEQMYRIEDNGHNIIGMRRVYMMENAGHGVADYIVTHFNGNLEGKNIVSICGTGNNGGDAIVASRHLSCYGANITIVLLGSQNDIGTEEAAINWKIIKKMSSIESIELDKSKHELDELIKSKIINADIIIDGIFGTGIKGAIRQPHALIIDLVNSSKAYVLSVDIPSGLDPNTGSAHDICVKADVTVTFHRLKTGLLKNKNYTGNIHLEKIGIPPEAEKGVW